MTNISDVDNPFNIIESFDCWFAFEKAKAEAKKVPDPFEELQVSIEADVLKMQLTCCMLQSSIDDWRSDMDW